MTTTPTARTWRGARDLDAAAAEQARAEAARAKAHAAEAAAGADLARFQVERERELAKLELAQKKARLDAELEAGARKRAEARRLEKQARRARRRAASADFLGAHAALLAVVPVIMAAGAVAVPAQIAYYTGEDVKAPTWFAVAAAFMTEGLTWTGAVLTRVAVARSKPAGRYRLLTWSAAGLAARLNYLHGQKEGAAAAAAYALASVAGVLAYDLYVHLTRHEADERSAEQIRRALLRVLFHPILSVRLAQARAAAVGNLDPDVAWRQVWADRYGDRYRVALPGLRPRRRLARRAIRSLPWLGKAFTPARPTVVMPGSMPVLPLIADRALSSAPSPTADAGRRAAKSKATPSGPDEVASPRPKRSAPATDSRGDRVRVESRVASGRRAQRAEEGAGLPPGARTAKDVPFKELVELARAWRVERDEQGLGRPSVREVKKHFRCANDTARDIRAEVWPEHSEQNQPVTRAALSPANSA